MEELSRWYDVQVIFENPAVMNECFTIEMQRFDDFNKVLRLIERTGMVTISVDWPYGDCKIEKREIWTIPRLSKVPEAQCEILMIQSYEKNQNEWVF